MQVKVHAREMKQHEYEWGFAHLLLLVGIPAVFFHPP